MQLSWCLEEKLARSTSLWRHNRSVQSHIHPAIWELLSILGPSLKRGRVTQKCSKSLAACWDRSRFLIFIRVQNYSQYATSILYTLVAKSAKQDRQDKGQVLQQGNNTLDLGSSATTTIHLNDTALGQCLPPPSLSVCSANVKWKQYSLLQDSFAITFRSCKALSKAGGDPCTFVVLQHQALLYFFFTAK